VDGNGGSRCRDDVHVAAISPQEHAIALWPLIRRTAHARLPTPKPSLPGVMRDIRAAMPGFAPGTPLRVRASAAG